MNKKEFLQKLGKKLRKIKKSEREKNISYYDEMLSDMMENGMSETDAVSKLGNINDIAKNILNNTDPAALKEKDKFAIFLYLLSAVALVVFLVTFCIDHYITNVAISIIGGADGPTSIFLAGKIGMSRFHVVYCITLLIIIFTVGYSIYKWKKGR